jgi:DNA-binding MarR family transcriptional regulator
MVFDSSASFGEAGGPTPKQKLGRHSRAGSGEAGVSARAGLNLSWEDIGFFGNAIAIASRQWRVAAKQVRDEFALGPHGPWIIGLIATNHVVYPSDLTKVLRCGRSLISAELNKLSEAGLINCRKSEEDGRQIELSVTPLGAETNKRVAESLTNLLEERLVHYTREDILYCARLLRDLAGSSLDAA